MGFHLLINESESLEWMIKHNLETVWKLLICLHNEIHKGVNSSTIQHVGIGIAMFFFLTQDSDRTNWAVWLDVPLIQLSHINKHNKTCKG